MGKISESTHLPVDDLIPYAKNARTHDDKQVDLIARSIQEFGFLNPILIDKEKNVIAGHGRIMAAQKIGMESVPVLYVEGLTEEQKRAYILADNRLTEMGGWDMDVVGQELEELQEAGFDIGLTGFDWDKAADPGADRGAVQNGERDPGADRGETGSAPDETGRHVDSWETPAPVRRQLRPGRHRPFIRRPGG